MIDNLDAQGHGGKPIVTSKEPVQKPCFVRGLMSIGLDYINDEHRDGTVTFTLPSNDVPGAPAVVTYHRARLTALHSGTSGMVGVMVEPTTLVTWDWRKAA